MTTHEDPSVNITHAAIPHDMAVIDKDRKKVKAALRKHGVPNNLLTNISTRALRSGRRQTGEFKSNRDPRWKLKPQDPQYGTEIDCKLIELRLIAMALQFDNAPVVDDDIRKLLEERYLGESIAPGLYRDSLLLERMSFKLLLEESEKSTQGKSNFHIGHEDPTLTPKHVPQNISWRSHRSNLIQGDMTLRAARVYFVKLIARYFELGEIDLK